MRIILVDLYKNDENDLSVYIYHKRQKRKRK